MDVDTPLIRALRDHLLSLSPVSLAPRDPSGRARANSPEEEAILARFLPFGELIFLVAWADGEVRSSERAASVGAFVALTGGRIPRKTLEKIESEARVRLEREGRDARVEAVCAGLSYTREDAELAFTLAAAVALADAKVLEDEIDLLKNIAACLGLPERRVTSLLSSVRNSEFPPSIGDETFDPT